MNQLWPTLSVIWLLYVSLNHWFCHCTLATVNFVLFPIYVMFIYSGSLLCLEHFSRHTLHCCCPSCTSSLTFPWFCRKVFSISRLFLLYFSKPFIACTAVCNDVFTLLVIISLYLETIPPALIQIDLANIEPLLSHNICIMTWRSRGEGNEAPASRS